MIAFRQNLLPKADPLIMESLNNLRRFLVQNGRPNKAEFVSREILALDTHELGPEHPRTLKDMRDLGVQLLENEKCSEAEDVLRKTVGLMEQVLGEIRNFWIDSSLGCQ